MKELSFFGNYKVKIVFTKEIFPLLKEKNQREKICITDENLYRIYGDRLEEIFGKNIFRISPGEKSKNMGVVLKILEFLCEKRVSRRGKIFGFGGGVVGDITGFVSGIYKRGIEFSLIPTSLISFVDSSIGGKCGINLKNCGKNYVGLFNHPSEIFFDFSLLSTLPQKEVNNGLFELIKYGFVLEKSILETFEGNLTQSELKKLIKISIQKKISVVIEDEREMGIRKVLNFGHTFGHALERASNYSLYSHGEAVGLGMIYALILGKNLNITDEEYLKKGIYLIKKINGLKLKRKHRWENLLNSMSMDKKVDRENSLLFVLTPTPGNFLFKEINDFTILKKTYGEFLKWI